MRPLMLVLAWSLGACSTLGRDPSASDAPHSVRLPPIDRPASCAALLAKIGEPERFLGLAWDPAHRKMTPNSIREARIGLYLEGQGLLPKPIKRELSGESEFIDGKGQLWDVKAFRSQDPNGERIPLEHMIKKINEEIDDGENIILDISFLDEGDRLSISLYLKSINAKERALWYDEARLEPLGL
jgi:hypothetical protein